jgi:hypothetical protein
MKCYNCIYYEQGKTENRCKAFGWDNFNPSENCDLVDEDCKIIKDDEGRDIKTNKIKGE